MSDRRAIDDFVRLREALDHVLEQMQVEGLRVEVDWNASVEEVVEVWQILNDPDMPLAERYPDGSKAQFPLTPKQVRYLSDTHPHSPVTHDQEEYQKALVDVRNELGRVINQPCMGKEGCRNPALAYSREQCCWNHASAEDRAHSKEMKAIEERRFHQRLDEIGLLERRGIKGTS